MECFILNIFSLWVGVWRLLSVNFGCDFFFLILFEVWTLFFCCVFTLVAKAFQNIESSRTRKFIQLNRGLSKPKYFIILFHLSACCCAPNLCGCRSKIFSICFQFCVSFTFFFFDWEDECECMYVWWSWWWENNAALQSVRHAKINKSHLNAAFFYKSIKKSHGNEIIWFVIYTHEASVSYVEWFVSLCWMFLKYFIATVFQQKKNYLILIISVFNKIYVLQTHRTK